jgi:hypothetical protein
MTFDELGTVLTELGTVLTELGTVLWVWSSKTLLMGVVIKDPPDGCGHLETPPLWVFR